MLNSALLFCSLLTIRSIDGSDLRPTFAPRDICGTDETREAKCYQQDEPRAYEAARAVVRLRIPNLRCTGWFVGDQGHLLTNWHCVPNATVAASVGVEAGAEGQTCGTICKSLHGCLGTIVNANPVEFIATGGNYRNDFTLL